MWLSVSVSWRDIPFWNRYLFKFTNCPPRWCDSINEPCLVVTIHFKNTQIPSIPSPSLSPEVIAHCTMVLFCNSFWNDDNIIIYAITFSMFISAHDGQCWQWLCLGVFFCVWRKNDESPHWIIYLMQLKTNKMANGSLCYIRISKQLISNEDWKEREREKKE